MLHIRIADHADADIICKLAVDTFDESYAAYNTAENMKLYVDANFNVSSIRNELNQPLSLFLLAELNKVPVGYIQLNFANQRPEYNSVKQAEIERLYVYNSAKGQRIGYSLVVSATKIAKEKGCGMLWLGVWEFNPKAKAFYERAGFVPFGTHIFQLGSDKQTDILMNIYI